MNAPSVEFVSAPAWAAFYAVRSTNDTIRFRLLERRKFTLFDADWFRTSWELSPAARDAIFTHCEGRASGWGGGVTMLAIRACPESAADVQAFLTRILSDPASWHRWDRDRLHFVPLQALEAAA